MSIWTDIFIPIMIGPVFIVGKYMWDQWSDREQDIIRRKHEKQMETWEENIREFYWPLYLHLIENQQLWKYAMIHRMIDGNNSICNDEESSEDEHEHETIPVNRNYTCAYRYNSGQGPQCGVSISQTQRKLFGNYCMAHFVESYTSFHTKSSWKSSDSSNTIVTVENHTVSSNIHKTDPTTIRDLILQNQTTMTEIIQTKLPRIHTKTRLGKYIIQFQQYCSQFKALNTNCKHTLIQNPRVFGANYPKRLISFLESKLLQTQQLLLERTENFYAEKNKSWAQLICNWGRS